MKTTAAVLVEPKQPLVLAELEIPRLAAGQVLVEIAYSGVCHTQLLEWQGDRGDDPYLPHCLGHEGSGTVLDVGSGVTRCRAGQRVLLSWIKAEGADVPGTTYGWKGRTVNAGGITTFQRHAVVSENRVTPLPDGVDLRDAALLGCAVPTGFGSVRNVAMVQPGQSVAIFGVGGVGLCAVMAAKIADAVPLIAVDIDPNRLEAATRLGATHALNANDQDVLQAINDINPGGVDAAIEATGRPEVMQQALAAVRRQGGSAVIVGNARAGQRLELDPTEFNLGKRLLGTWGGDTIPDRDFPLYFELLSTAQLDFQPLTAASYRLSDINRALEDLKSRHAIRPLVEMRVDSANVGGH